MNLEQIRNRRAEIAAELRRFVAIVEKGNRTLSEDEVTVHDDLEAEDASLAATERVMLDDETRASALRAEPVQQRGRASGSVRGAILAVGSRGAPAVLTKTTQAQRNGDSFKGQSWARMNLAKITAAVKAQRGEQESVPGLLQRLYPGRPELAQIASLQQRIRASGVEGGAILSGEQGAELLSLDAGFTGDFVEFLYSKTLFDQMNFRRMPADVRVKGQDGAFTGYFVGEKKPIPASIGSYNSVDLVRLKAAGLTYLSRDLLERSAPAAELLFVHGVTEAISQAVDTLAFSATGASANVAPAGLFNAVAGTASVGGRLQDLYADLAYLTGIFVAAKNADGDLTLVSNRTIANQIAHLLRADNGLPAFAGQVTMNGGTLNGLKYKTGDNVVAGTLALIKPSDVWVIADSGVRVELSGSATIEADTAPAGEGVGPTTMSANMVSMFQTDSVAIKAVRDINWQYRRTATIVTARRTAVKYDGTESTTD
ncbi:MAG TPA: phage major capsid protein [Steroidobacteraceae bacterium]|nr:phage major capsid protein [Steroidobacteraceae bacterium]